MAKPKTTNERIADALEEMVWGLRLIVAALSFIAGVLISNG